VPCRHEHDPLDVVRDAVSSPYDVQVRPHEHMLRLVDVPSCIRIDLDDLERCADTTESGPEALRASFIAGLGHEAVAEPEPVLQS
jgi:hypothetical protein